MDDVRTNSFEWVIEAANESTLIVLYDLVSKYTWLNSIFSLCASLLFLCQGLRRFVVDRLTVCRGCIFNSE